MSDEPKGRAEEQTSRWSIPSWRRIGDFFFTVAQLERSYQALKSNNDQLSEGLARLQRQVDEQSGQLKVLLTFVQSSLKEQVEVSADRAAARHAERRIGSRSSPPDDSR